MKKTHQSQRLRPGVVLWSLGLAAFLLTTFSISAGEAKVMTTYQPIITSEGHQIMAVPFLVYHYHGKPPYSAITHPHELPSDAPRSIRLNDANLLSSCHIRIGQNLDDDILMIRFESFIVPSHAPKIDLVELASLTLECIRRVAHEYKHRPQLEIIGKPEDQKKWEALEKAFAEHDLSQPFVYMGD